MNFQVNTAPNANRAWQIAIIGWEGGNYSNNVIVDSFTALMLLFQFLNPHPSDLLDPRKAVP